MGTDSNQGSSSQGDTQSTGINKDTSGQVSTQGWQVNARKKKKKNKNTSPSSSEATSKFEGAESELSNFVFDASKPNSSQDLFKTTVRGIAEHVATKYDDAGEFRLGMIDMSLPTLTEPTAPSDPSNVIELKKWEVLLRRYENLVHKRKSNLERVFPLILGQCSPTIRDRLEARDDWASINQSNDVIGLLKGIQASMNQKATNRHPIHSAIEAQTNLLTFQQTSKMSVSEFKDKLVSMIEICESLGLHPGQDTGLVDRILEHESNPTQDQIDDAKKAAREEYIATLMIMKSDPRRYGDLIADCNNDYIRGDDRAYPRTQTEAYDRLVNYKSRHVANTKVNDTEIGSSFYINDSGGRGRGDGGGRGGGRGSGRGSGRGRGGNSGGSRNEANSSENTDTRANGQQQEQTHAQEAQEGTSNANSNNASRYVALQSTYETSTHQPMALAMHSFQDGACSDSSSPKSGNTVHAYDKNCDHDIRLPEERACLVNRAGHLSSEWILLDSCSTVNIFKDEHLLHGVTHADKPITIFCNAGTVTLSHIGWITGFDQPIWIHKKGVANILSLDKVSEQHRVTMDTATKNAFFVHRHDGSTIEFRPSAKGLYHHKLNGHIDNSWVLVSTVQQQQSKYTQQQLRRAIGARKMQNIVMRPGDRAMTDKIISHLKGCPITKEDMKIAIDVHGPNIGSLKGKTVRRAVKPGPRNTDPVPKSILRKHKRLSIAFDIMFINKETFFVTYCRELCFTTITPIDSRQITIVRAVLKSVCKMYKQRGFKISAMYADPEFETLKTHFPQVQTCGADDHVGDIERRIRTIKDRVRSAYRMLPFQYVPRVIMRRLVRNVALWLNAFPGNNGPSDRHSPRYIMTGQELTYKKHVRTEFGAYVQVHEEHSNDMNERTTGAICCGPTGDPSGSHWFMSTATGQLLRRTRWTELPMPPEIVDRVNYFGQRQRMPRTLTFGDRHAHEIPDTLDNLFEDDSDNDSDASVQSNDDESLELDTVDDSDASVSSDSSDDDHDEQDDDDQNYGENTGVEHNRSTQVDISRNTGVSINKNPGVDTEQERDANIDIQEQSDIEQENTVDSDDDDITTERDSIDNISTGRNQSDNDVLSEDEDSDVRSGEEDDDEDDQALAYNEEQENPTTYEQFLKAQQEGVRAAERNEDLPKREPKPSTRYESDFVNAMFADYDDDALFTMMVSGDLDKTFCFVTAQMSAKAGLKRFGDAGEAALIKEMEQLVYRKVMKGKKAKNLTHEDKRRALKYLMFLKEKRRGRIKGRGCADGRKQRIYKGKEDVSSPTMSTESLFLTCVIDALERRNVITCDIPGAFMQTDIDEYIHVKLEGEIAMILIKIAPEYKEFLTYEKKKPVIYAELKKALYGTVQAAMLFWRDLRSYLVDTMGFKPNPYDLCIVNKNINGKQCTIGWHVDDLKISHADAIVTEDIIKALNDRFGKEAPLVVHRGKKHNYLGMEIDFTKDGEVRFSQQDYVNEIVNEAHEELLTASAQTPAANHLFDINPEAEVLDEEKATIFHHLVAKSLYISKRARPDIHLAISFLTTRVQAPDVDDWKKLGRMITYLRDTNDLDLCVSADESGVIHWWVDASFAVHSDYRSHTGASMSMGKGCPINISSKQKLNTRSSTEAELVGINDAMTMMLWVRLFLMAQGFNVEENILYQDNQSTMLLAKNGRQSSGKKTRHIEIRYYFVTDQIAQGHVTTKYCPTEEMLADFFTKPLQGVQLRKLRQLLMNLPAAANDSLQECVEASESSHDEHSRDLNSRGSKDSNGALTSSMKVRTAKKVSYADVVKKGLLEQGSLV